VFLAYASEKGAAFIDRALSLPRAWTQDAERRTEAGIPEEVRFASKITLAERMLARAFDAGVPARWVIADSFSGRSHAFRRWLEGRDIASAVMIPRTSAVEYQGQRLRAEQLGERLAAVGRPAWTCLALSGERAEGMGRWLLVRCDADDPSEDAYRLADGTAGASDEELIRVCTTRWQVEEGFAQAKGEVGLDHYAVRTWVAWHRFVTLCLLAHARVPSGWHRRPAPGCPARRNRGKRDADSGLIPLTVPEVRRLVRAMAEGVWEMGGRLQTVSALVRSGSVATDRGGVGKRRNESVAVGYTLFRQCIAAGIVSLGVATEAYDFAPFVG